MLIKICGVQFSYFHKSPSLFTIILKHSCVIRINTFLLSALNFPLSKNTDRITVY